MGKWTYRIATIVMIVAIAGGAAYWVWLRLNEETNPGPYREEWGDSLWLLYPNGGEVSGIVTIRWDVDRVGLSEDAKVTIGWTHDLRGGGASAGYPYKPSDFKHEDWEGCYCSIYRCIVCNKENCKEHTVPNTGEYQWNASEVLEINNDETYPYYIRITGAQYLDASDYYFNITS